MSSPARPAGLTVVLDPGHNGANAAHPTEINRPVPNGRGGTKACNTTGTSTHGGYPEHAFTWDIALRVRDALTARGVQVVMHGGDRGDDVERLQRERVDQEVAVAVVDVAVCGLVLGEFDARRPGRPT